MGLARLSFLIAPLVAASLGAAAPAQAAVRPEGVDIQQFRPGAGATDYLSVLGGFPGKHLTLDAGLIFNWAKNPLYDNRSGVGGRAPALKSQGSFDLLAAFSLFDRLELGIALPITGMITPGDGHQTGVVAEPGGFAVGDLRLTPKVKILGNRRGWALSVAAPMSLPVGNGFASYGAFSVEPTLVADFVPASYFRFTLNFGARFRPTMTYASLKLGRELTWGLGLQASFDIGDQPFSIIGSLDGAIELPNSATENAPVEFLAGFQWHGLQRIKLFAAIGAGFTGGYGSPDLRTVIGVRYSEYQRCSYGPEDLDGFEDDDDCAEPDNDDDGFVDASDQCPNEPETVNGLDDDDGCPDSRPDFGDLGDGRGFSVDGATDTDGDGVLDKDDACPAQAEDTDGFEDTDGCPDPDNDGDGILDMDDRCPIDGEVINDFEDTDGCPDNGLPKLVRVDEITNTIDIADKIYFGNGKAHIEEKSFPLLAAITQVLKLRKDITKTRIEGHTDSAGSNRANKRLSQRRADAVRDYLIAQGIAADRLLAEGYGEMSPIASNRTREGRSTNRRVEFVILEYNGEPVGHPELTEDQP